MRLIAAWTDWAGGGAEHAAAVAAGVHGRRRAGLLRAAVRACRCGSAAAAALVPAAAAIRLPRLRWLLVPVVATALGFASARVATALAPPIEADLPYHATVVKGAVHAVEILPEGRRIIIQPAFLDDSARTVAALRPGAAAVERRRRPANRRQRQRARGASADRRRRPIPEHGTSSATPSTAGLGASGYAVAAVERTAQAQPQGVLRLVQRLRETIASRVSAVIPGAAGAVSVTLLTGASMAIPQADHAAFRDSGLAHLLAVAGLHIGIVMGFALVLARFGFALSEHASLFWPTKKLAALAALAAGGGYMVLTGMHVPIMRSFAMACLFTLAVLADRLAVSLRGLAVAATVLMLLVPWEVPDVSFQMSFSAVLALIAGYEALRPWLRRLHGASWRRRFASHLAALALTSALAGIGIGAVRGVSFRPCAGLFRAGQHGRGAADRAVGDAGGPDWPDADAAASGGSGAGADGLGR